MGVGDGKDGMVKMLALCCVWCPVFMCVFVYTVHVAVKSATLFALLTMFPRIVVLW